MLTYDDLKTAGSSKRPMLSRKAYADYDKAHEVAVRQGLRPDGIGFSSKKKIAWIYKEPNGSAMLTIYQR